MTREEAINELREDIELYAPLHGSIEDLDRDLPDGRLVTALEMAIEALSTDIVRCKDCRKHNQGINEAPYLADRCPLIIHRGYAKGHEFDYQFCCFGERKE